MKYDGLLICLSETRAMGVAHLKIVMVKVLLFINFYVEPIVLLFSFCYCFCMFDIYFLVQNFMKGAI